MSESPFLTLFVVGALLAFIGQAINEKEPPPWRWWRRTLWLHPAIAGAAVGLLFHDLPVPEAMGPGLAGRAMWFAMSGIFAVPLYEAAQAWIKARSEG